MCGDPTTATLLFSLAMSLIQTHPRIIMVFVFINQSFVNPHYSLFYFVELIYTSSEKNAQREAVEELCKQEEEELIEQTRSGEMGGEEGRKEEQKEKEELNKKEKERKRRWLKLTTPKKKSERTQERRTLSI